MLESQNSDFALRNLSTLSYRIKHYYLASALIVKLSECVLALCRRKLFCKTHCSFFFFLNKEN